jgi:signal transduction histidine kinase
LTPGKLGPVVKGHQPLLFAQRLNAWLAWLPSYAWLALLLAVLLVGLYRVSLPGAVTGAATVSIAQIGLPDAPNVPLRKVTLPHILDDEAPAWRQRVDYTLAWPEDLNTPSSNSAPLAVLLPRVGTRFRLLLNGVEVHQVGWRAPAEQTVNSAWLPYLVALPTPLLKPLPHENVLKLEVQGQLLERSGVWPVQIGPYHQLQTRYDVLFGWQVTGTWMMALASALMALMAGFMWWHLRERLFALLAAMLMAHVVRLVLSVLVMPPMAYETYFMLHRVSFTLYCGFLYLFIEHLFGYRIQTGRRLSYAVLLIGPLWIGLTLALQNYNLYRIWAGVLAFVGLLMLVQVVYRSRMGQRMESDQKTVMVVAVFTLCTGLRDFAVVQLNLPGDADLRWMALGSLALMFTFGWILVKKSTHAVTEAKRLNETLAKRVMARENELIQAFDQLSLSDRQRTLEGERRRLMRDMHDGLGSQLVQAINAVRSGTPPAANHVADMLQHALEELRMTLDSLEPMDGDLPTILGTLRRRISPALEAAGIELNWQVQEVPVLQQLDSRGVMHLFRCMQEIFANVIKHAHAHTVTVRTWQGDGMVFLGIQDDGVGMTHSRMDAISGGRGLGNIQVRAAKMGAQVAFASAKPGTCVTFSFVLDRGATDPVSTDHAPWL